MPYVCLRVPTGGGKTLLACHAIGLAMDELLHAERAVVLWLVPSNTILDQTAAALRDPRHPYRWALESACGTVEVVIIEEALRLSRATVDGQTVVIVSTLQVFRVEDPTGRKVYDQNGVFLEHFTHVPADRLADLKQGADGNPKPSLVNMLRLRRPIVIVDEAHNARTDLSFSALGDVLPSCIIEFTATPARAKHPSNVLHYVSGAELSTPQAQMIKLPLWGSPMCCAYYGPPRDARGNRSSAEGESYGHISGIVLRGHSRPSCPDRIRAHLHPYQPRSLGGAGSSTNQVFGNAGLAFPAITVRFTLRNWRLGNRSSVRADPKVASGSLIAR